MNGTLSGPAGHLNAATDVNITSASGATVTVPVNLGAFVTYLPNNSTYTVNVNYHTETSINGSMRYVLYSGSQHIALAQNNLGVNILTQQSLDNVTVSGSITGASSTVDWTFVPLDETSMNFNGSSSASSYSFQLAPGNYSVYAVSGSDVYLGVIRCHTTCEQQHELRSSPREHHNRNGHL